MWSFMGSLAAADTADSAKETVRRAGHTINSWIITPVLRTVSHVSQTVHDWVEPVPPASETHKVMWKRQNTYKAFVENEPIELFHRFETPAERATITQNHVFCALHHPGLALDLCVLFNIKLDDEHLKYVLNHYANAAWNGSQRDRLSANLCDAMERRYTHPAPDQTYEMFIRETLYDRSSLLFRVLDDHRYTYSPRAFTGRPETLTKLNEMLREKQAQRLRHQ